MGTYYREKTDPTFQRRVGSPHIDMYNPARAGASDYIFGWTFNDLLPHGGNSNDIRAAEIIRPPSLGGKDIGVSRIKEREEMAVSEALKRKELELEIEQKRQEEKEAKVAETEVPAKEAEVPTESPDNWRNWSRPKLIKYGRDKHKLDIHLNTKRENVVKKIEEAMHYVEPTE